MAVPVTPPPMPLETCPVTATLGIPCPQSAGGGVLRSQHSGATGAPPVRTAAFPQGRGMLSEPRRGEFMSRAEGRTKAGRARSVVDAARQRPPDDT